MIMKKLLLLALVALGGVMNASATDYYVAGTKDNVNGDVEWSNTSDVNKMIAVDENHYYLVVESCELTKDETYKFKVTPYNDWGTTYPESNYEFSVDKAGTYTLIYTFDNSSKAVNVVPVLNMTLSNNYNGADIWDTYNANGKFSHEAGTYKWTLDLPATSTTAGDWYFRIFKDGLLSWNSTEGKNKIVPNDSNKELSLGGDADANAWIGSNTRSWKVAYPDFAYDHMTITAEYNIVSQYANNWKISVDCYISKTISSEGYATFGSAAAVDFSKAEPALTAQKGVVGSDGKITWANVTTLAANKGALLQGNAGTYLIPVTTTGDDTDNDFVAITEEKRIAQTMDGKNAYILTKVDDVLGFYKPASGDGSWCAAGTAYLATNVYAARGFFPIWDDATAIDVVKQNKAVEGDIYNLAGQRLTQPTKGLNIVNGKKVIIK